MFTLKKKNKLAPELFYFKFRLKEKIYIFCLCAFSLANYNKQLLSNDADLNPQRSQRLIFVEISVE